jgi:hypothetical protein
MTGRLYNDGGVLTLPVCMIGIDDGLNKGICTFPVAETISLAGCSNENWLKIELTVSGAATTLAASDIAGATDPTVIPASVRAAWDGLKGAFHLSTSKRLIGLAWLNASGVLLAVVNFDGQKIWASQIGLHTGTINNQYEPGKGFVIPTGDWDMDSTAQIVVAHNLGVFYKGIQKIVCIIRSDVDSVPTPNIRIDLSVMTDSADPGLLGGGISTINDTNIYLNRRTGAAFDNANYDATSYNRGNINIRLCEF